MRMVEIALEESKGEPVSFKLAEQSFDCLHSVPASIHLALKDWDSGIVKTVAFIEGVLKDDAEVKRFRKLIDSEREIHLQTLVDLMTKLIEVYSGRPLDTSSPSPNGPKNTSPSSKPRSKPKAKRSSG